MDEKKTVIDTSLKRTPRTSPPTQGRKGGYIDAIYAIVILLLIVLGGFLGWKLAKKNEVIAACYSEQRKLKAELTSLNEMMYKQGIDLGEDLKENLQKMLSMYELMEVDNEVMTDSIKAQKDKIQGLMTALEDAKGDKVRYASQVYKLQKETETLRSIMKDYIRTIDSLNYANGTLTQNLENTLEDLENTQNTLSDVKKQRDVLSDKVNKGARLSASGFTTTGVKEKNSGGYKKTNRARNTTHIRSCFTVGKNVIASSGSKTLYLRVMTPGGTVLNTSQRNSFQAEDQKILLYSDKRTINYQNQATDVCVFYELKEDAAKGNYSAHIYCEGVLIGTDDFVLK